jgi:hypothetical protein
VLKSGAIIIIEQRNEDRIDDLHPLAQVTNKKIAVSKEA